MKPVAIVGWSGQGKLEDLQRTVLRKVAASDDDDAAERVGSAALLLRTGDPVAAARSLSLLPGVAWIAVGYRFEGTDGYMRTLALLGRRYLLSKGRAVTFRISAQTTRSKQSQGDLVLAGNSELLASIPGARVDERKPHVRFRVCLEGNGGACGVEILGGPGGVPTGGEWVSCLVSGGERSSSMAWMAALSGFSVRLVHSRTNDVALRQVARLYSELSFRMDARSLEVVSLEGEGGEPGVRIGQWLLDHRGVTFAGLRPERADVVTVLARSFPNLALPLILVQDDSIREVYRALGIGPPAPGVLSLKTLEAMEAYSETRFGGVQADPNAVIDTLTRKSKKRGAHREV